VREERDSCGRELNRACRAVEELPSELVLESADLLADRGLDDVELLGGATEVAQLSDGKEVPELANLHASPH